MSRQPGTASLIRAKSNLKGFKGNRNFNTNFQNTVERTKKSKNAIKTFDELDENNISEFFKDINAYDGLFTTQQLQDVDFSKFENHVFFDSAVDKVSYAYDKILNKFPYDKSSHEFNQYFIKLDGFTKYVYDNFIPKNKGYLRFDGNNVLEGVDITGFLFEDYELDKKIGLVNLNKNKFSFDFWLYVNDVVDNDELGTQIIFQKINNSNGITIFVDTFDDNNVENKKYCNINCILTNSNNFIKIKSKIPIAEFVHINFSFGIRKGKKTCKFYKNGIRKKAITEGSFNNNLVFDSDFLKSPFFIGNGNNHTVLRDNTLNVVKSFGLKGLIDEFRFFIGERSEKSIVLETTENIFANKFLQIYYKFNEPSGEYLNNNIVLDSSGHRAHGLIKNFDNNSFYTEAQISEYKTVTDVLTPLIYEKEANNPVIFPRFGNILQDQQTLSKKAIKYDKINPNVFWKFFPKNLFVNESDFSSKPELFASEEIIGTKEKSINLLEVNIPKNNLLINLISIWARFFDQLKCYIDQIIKVNNLSYDELNSSNRFNSIALPYAVSKLGFDFKEIFPSPLLEKINDKNLSYEKVFSENNIRQIQNNLWKRFLINSQDYIRSKGTKKSIRSAFNSFGLESDLFVKIREFNFQNKLNFYPGLTQKNTSLNCINFNNLKLLDKTVSYDANGLPENSFLVGTKIFDINESQNLNMTDGDWSIESFIKFDHLNIENYSNTQNILRIDAISNSDNNTPYINLFFKRDKKTSKKGKISLYVNHTGLESDLLTIDLNDVDLLCGKIFYIHIGRKFVNSSNSIYYIDITNSDFGSKNSYITSKHKEIRHALDTSDIKSFILRTGFSSFYSQDTINSFPNIDLNTNFQGKIINLKAWKKLLNNKEKNIHKSDIFCIGLESNSVVSSKDQLLINVSLKEKLDNYKNELVANNKIILKNSANFSDKTEIFVPDLALQSLDILKRFDYVTLRQSTSFDYPENYNRVNVNSYENDDFAKSFNNYNVNPSHETESDFNINNNVRLSIDFSTSNFIDKEISKLILVNDYFTQNLSNRSNMYEENYKSLELLRNVFYEKLEKEINISQLYQVYKYFDNILEEILYETVPLKVNYQGFNFVVESSIAERSKYVYKMAENRLPIVDSKVDYNRYNKNYMTLSYNNNNVLRRDIFNESSNSDFVINN